MRDLKETRLRINEIDDKLYALFNERIALSHDVADYKRAMGTPIYDAHRERENIAAAMGKVDPRLSNYAATIQSVLMQASRDEQYHYLGLSSETSINMKNAMAASPAYFPQKAVVACQGVEGAYQQIACDRMFKHAQVKYFKSFEEVFVAVEEGQCDYGVRPIENSTAGSVNHVFDLMMSHRFSIVRTCRLKIDHNLLVKPGVKREDVKIVYSHQQAISQCADYSAHIPGCQVQVCENTAIASQIVAQSDRRDIAALASRSCAELYGLEIADSAVQDLANNYTRFACIARNLTIFPGADRASLMAITPHEPGSLYKVLGLFYSLDVNLVKLESRPIPGRDFEWMFYFDIECPAAAPEMQTLLDSLGDVCEDYRYLGSYAEVI